MKKITVLILLTACTAQIEAAERDCQDYSVTPQPVPTSANKRFCYLTEEPEKGFFLEKQRTKHNLIELYNSLMRKRNVAKNTRPLDCYLNNLKKEIKLLHQIEQEEIQRNSAAGNNQMVVVCEEQSPF